MADDEPLAPFLGTPLYFRARKILERAEAAEREQDDLRRLVAVMDEMEDEGTTAERYDKLLDEWSDLRKKLGIEL